jgi:putative ABC transport system permease protein
MFLDRRRRVERLLQDVRYGLRSFLRRPGFTLTAVMALALGIGANTAVFSVVHGVLIRPLPFPDPGAIVYIHDSHRAVPNASVSFQKLVALRDESRTLAALGGSTPAGLTLTGGGEPEQVPGTRVTHGFLEALGVRPLLGRWFTAEEDTPHGPRVILLSEGLWRRRFAADPAVVGRAVPVNGVSHTVVGVMPHDAYPVSTQAWVPLGLSLATASQSNVLRLLGRMKPGVTVHQVRQDLEAVTVEFNRRHNLQRDVRVWRLHEIMVADHRRMLLILQGAVVFVLLVACANVANLLLARSVTRQRELAIRAAIGAGRWRIVRQLLTESLMLAALGGVAGVLLASWLIRLFTAVAPAGFPRMPTIALDGAVLAVTLGVAAVTGLVFGLAPAREGFRTDTSGSLRETGTRGATAGAARGASRLLVVAEVALALVLVVGAGLMVKSLTKLGAEDIGFDPDGVFTFNLSLPAARYPDTAPEPFYRRLLEQLRGIPGVQAAGAISYAPMTNFGFNGPFAIEGRPPFEPGTAPITEYRWVSPGYFATMGIPLLRGSDFTSAHTGTDRPVVIINETMARRHFGDTDPIGARLWLAADPRTVVREVIGVVGDIRDASLDRAPVAESFVPHAQAPLPAMSVVVRVAGEIGIDRVLPAVRERIAALDPELPIVRPQTMAAAMKATTSRTRMTSVVTSLFALVAALLATLGVYSLIAYSIAQRTREIGIRVALGAERKAVVALVVREGLALALAGVAVGIPVAFALTRLLETLLYEVSPTDPAVLAATSAGVLLVAAVASVVPAVRALRIDPMVALRSE